MFITFIIGKNAIYHKITSLNLLAFRVAVDTAKSALKWQELQKERWDLNKKACGVTIVRHPNNNMD